MTPLNDIELYERMSAMHEEIQRHRHAISQNDELPPDHPRLELWKALLDAEYYCLQAAGELGSLLSEEGK